MKKIIKKGLASLSLFSCLIAGSACGKENYHKVSGNYYYYFTNMKYEYSDSISESSKEDYEDIRKTEIFVSLTEVMESEIGKIYFTEDGYVITKREGSSNGYLYKEYTQNKNIIEHEGGALTTKVNDGISSNGILCSSDSTITVKDNSITIKFTCNHSKLLSITKEYKKIS